MTEPTPKDHSQLPADLVESLRQKDPRTTTENFVAIANLMQEYPQQATALMAQFIDLTGGKYPSFGGEADSQESPAVTPITLEEFGIAYLTPAQRELPPGDRNRLVFHELIAEISAGSMKHLLRLGQFLYRLQTQSFSEEDDDDAKKYHQETLLLMSEIYDYRAAVNAGRTLERKWMLSRFGSTT